MRTKLVLLTLSILAVILAINLRPAARLQYEIFFRDLQQMYANRALFWHAVTEKDLQVGDHLYSKRYLGLYVHHGLYIGNDTVIHFSGTLPEDARIVQCTLKEFSGWQAWRIRRAPYGVNEALLWLKIAGTAYKEESNASEIVLERARELMRVTDTIRFSIFEKNCEGFVFFCKTGLSWRSIQSEKIPLPVDLIYPHVFLNKALYWILKVVSTICELIFTVLRFEM
jgi:hypothetical protein